MHTNTLLTAPLRLLPAVLAALSLLLAACSDHDEQGQRIVDADRTVLVYMPWTGSTTSSSKSLYNEFLNNIRDIEAAIGQSGGLGKTRLLVFISQRSDRATLIDIWHDGTNCRRDTLKHYTTPTPTTTEAILDVLRDAYRISPTPQYSMIVGSHGSGWMPAGSHPWKARAFGGTEKATQTEIADFAKAIELSPMKKLNYLCFDDCYMANIETAYALRNVTNYFLGSTSEVMSAGLPYRTVWHALSAEPDYASVCSNFLAFYSSYSMPYGTFTAINCQATEQLAALMRQANATYTLAPADAESVMPLDGFPQHVFFDMKSYTTQLCQGSQLGDDIARAIEQAVIATVTTPLLYSIYMPGDHTFTGEGSCGITISDPSTNKAAIETKTATEWWSATH